MKGKTLKLLYEWIELITLIVVENVQHPKKEKLRHTTRQLLDQLWDKEEATK